MIWLRQDTEPLISNHLYADKQRLSPIEYPFPPDHTSKLPADYSFLFKVNMLKYLYRAFYDCLHHKWRGTVPTWKGSGQERIWLEMDSKILLENGTNELMILEFQLGDKEK